MNNLNSIIDNRRLQLLLKHISEKEKKNLNKRLNTIYKGFGSDSLLLIELLDRFNDANFSTEKLPNYTVGNRDVVIVNSDKMIPKIIKDILEEKYVGFDTEQKPTFKRGERQKDISIIQIATKNFCYIIQTKFIKNIKPITNIISNPNIVKVGFDLKNDNKEMKTQWGITPSNIFDLSPFMKNGFLHRNQIGVKNTVGLILLQKMQKSKKIAMSNWEHSELAHNQVKYASEDATAPYDVYEHILKNFPNFIK